MGKIRSEEGVWIGSEDGEIIVRTCRYRLLSLWVSQVARSLADNCFRMFVVLTVAQPGQALSDAAWHQVTPFFVMPFILLAPFNGAISNSLPKGRVLVFAAGFCMCVAALAGMIVGVGGNPWLWCLALGFHAVGAAVYSPTRYAVLSAASEDAKLPLSRTLGWIEMGGAAGIVAGLVAGWYLQQLTWDQISAGWSEQLHHVPVAVAAVAGFNLVALLAALPASFPSDVRRPETPLRAVAGFFRDTSRVLKDAETRWTLLGLASFMALMIAGSGALVAYTLSPAFAEHKSAVPQAMLLVSLGVAAGSLLAGIQRHPRRGLGLVPLAGFGLLIALAWAAAASNLTWPSLLLGLMGGIINVPLRTAYQYALPADARGNGLAVMNTANYLFATVMAVLFFGLARLQVLTPTGQLWLLAALAAVGAVVAWRVLLRELIEQVSEIILAPCYRVHIHGPGFAQLPQRGPVVVIANHTAWFDPLWLGKVVPRRIYPMMTSRFYDLPFMRWLMNRVVRAIRVPEAKFRREAPELDEAVAVLDRGDCLVIFPEGALKRHEEVALRQFGQGVWRILHQRPQTPVIVCWIEGGWGSYISYKGGPPTVNKHLDWWRRIDIAFGPRQIIDASVLEDHRATRVYLMKACVESRRHLGLEPLPLRQAVADVV